LDAAYPKFVKIADRKKEVCDKDLVVLMRRMKIQEAVPV